MAIGFLQHFTLIKEVRVAKADAGIVPIERNQAKKKIEPKSQSFSISAIVKLVQLKFLNKQVKLFAIIGIRRVTCSFE